MDKIMKNLYNEIIEYLDLVDFFRLKQTSKAMKDKLESTQHLVMKREAFNLFCAHLYQPDNHFR